MNNMQSKHQCGQTEWIHLLTDKLTDRSTNILTDRQTYWLTDNILTDIQTYLLIDKHTDWYTNILTDIYLTNIMLNYEFSNQFLCLFHIRRCYDDDLWHKSWILQPFNWQYYSLLKNNFLFFSSRINIHSKVKWQK